MKMGFFTITRNGESPADPGVLPLPETLESGYIRAALPRTGELSAGEANDEIARNAGAGVVPAAEIPLTRWPNGARHGRARCVDPTGAITMMTMLVISLVTIDASGMSQHRPVRRL
jgi:hypothetical protein